MEIYDAKKKILNTLRCHQTWQWQTDHVSVIFLLKPILRGFSIAMFDYKRGISSHRESDDAKVHRLLRHLRPVADAPGLANRG